MQRPTIRPFTLRDLDQLAREARARYGARHVEALVEHYRRFWADERGFLQFAQQGALLGGNVLAVTYTGTTSGVWVPSNGDTLGFSTSGAGSWTFTITIQHALTIKGVGPGGFGGWSAASPHDHHGGGGGGAYHLGLAQVFSPGIVYEVITGAKGSGNPTTIGIQGGALMLQLNAGAVGTSSAGGAGGTSPTGGGSTGGDGAFNANSTNSAGTAGGAGGGPGDIGGLSSQNGFNSGTSADFGSVTGETRPNGFDGGDGGYGRGLSIAGASRGGGGGGYGAEYSGVPKPKVNVELAQDGGISLTR